MDELKLFGTILLPNQIVFCTATFTFALNYKAMCNSISAYDNVYLTENRSLTPWPVC
jgi:hypothetical protein